VCRVRVFPTRGAGCVADGVVISGGSASLVQHAPTEQLREVLRAAEAMVGGSVAEGSSMEPSLAQAALDQLGRQGSDTGDGAGANGGMGGEMYEDAGAKRSAAEVQDELSGAKRPRGDGTDADAGMHGALLRARGTLRDPEAPMMIPAKKYLDMQLTPRVRLSSPHERMRENEVTRGE
jgi:hypothetical protein